MPLVQEPTDMSDPYYKIQSRKFTLAPYGGFDGWDIYRKYRTNSDQYIRGKSGFLNGACISTQFPNAKGDGSFKLLSQTPWGESGFYATTDYYAYYLELEHLEIQKRLILMYLLLPVLIM